jgi:hypothetical protein
MNEKDFVKKEKVKRFLSEIEHYLVNVQMTKTEWLDMKRELLK